MHSKLYSENLNRWITTVTFYYNGMFYACSYGYRLLKDREATYGASTSYYSIYVDLLLYVFSLNDKDWEICAIIVKFTVTVCSFSLYNVSYNVFLWHFCSDIRAPIHLLRSNAETLKHWAISITAVFLCFLSGQQDVEKFTDIEKLYLYLKLPTGSSINTDKR